MIFHVRSPQSGPSQLDGLKDIVPANSWKKTATHDYDITELHESLLTEHEGLAAIDQQEKLHQLVLGVPTSKREIVQRLIVPMEAVGKSLTESDFRNRFGVQVIGIEQSDGSVECPPNPDVPLQTDQRLVAIVFRESL